MDRDTQKVLGLFWLVGLGWGIYGGDVRVVGLLPKETPNETKTSALVADAMLAVLAITNNLSVLEPGDPQQKGSRVKP